MAPRTAHPQSRPADSQVEAEVAAAADAPATNHIGGIGFSRCVFQNTSIEKPRETRPSQPVPKAFLMSPRMRITSRILRLVVLVALLMASLGSFHFPAVFGQADSVLIGVVTTKDGQPVADVLVYGSLSKNCCPFKREETKTDEKGDFRLTNPGAVVHFSKDPFEPKSLVVEPQKSPVRITLESSANDMVMPSCIKPGPHRRRIGWGKFGLQFDVATREVEILGGKADVDYVRYVIKSRTGGGYLELWFGPYAMNSQPDDDLFIHSINFQQRNVVDASGGRMGMDSSGKLESGEVWRQTFVISEGARYRTGADNVELFNRIIDSACYVPYPEH
jgi:hypothetical protein